MLELIKEVSERNNLAVEERKELEELFKLEVDGLQDCFIPTCITENNCNLNYVIESQLKNCYRNTNERVIGVLVAILTDLYSCKKCGLCEKASLC